MPIPRNVYSLNTKVGNPTYNPSLSRNTHGHLRLLRTAAGEVRKLIWWFPTKVTSTCESVTQCQVLLEVTARERWSFRFQSPMKQNQKDFQKKNQKWCFPPSEQTRLPPSNLPCTGAKLTHSELPSSAPRSGTQMGQKCLFSVPTVKKLHSP